VIQVLEGGDFKVTSYALSDESRSVWAVVTDFVDEKGITDPQTIADAIKVDLRTIQLSRPVLEDLLRRFSELRFSPFLSNEILPSDTSFLYLDGVVYECWFYTTLNQLNLVLGADTVDHEQKYHPLLLWMDDLQKTVDGVRREGPPSTSRESHPRQRQQRPNPEHHR
jgi:hypothetical protein